MVLERYKKSILIVILILALFFRLYSVYVGLGSNHFSKIDEFEAYEWGEQLRYYSHSRFFTYVPGPYQNIIAWCLVNAAKTVWSFYLFWVVIGVWCTWLVYWLTNRFFKSTTYGLMLSLASSLWFAVMPWSVRFTNCFWNPHFLIPLTALLSGYFWAAISENKSRAIAGAVIAGFCMPLFHMEVLYLVPVVIMVIIIRYVIAHRKHDGWSLNYGGLFAGLGISVLIWMPFLLFDRANSWYILGSYFKPHSGLYIFHPETFKALYMPVLVMSDEISRFVGHTYFEYSVFLKRSFGFAPFGLVLILSTVLYAAYSFFIALKESRAIRQFAFIALMILGPLLLHMLSMQVYEERYTNIYFPLLPILAAYPFVRSINSKSEKKGGQLLNKIVIAGFILTIALGCFINIQFYAQERTPNIDGAVRLIPSLIYYEKIKDGIFSHYLSKTGKKAGLYSSYFGREMLIDNKSPPLSQSLYSLGLFNRMEQSGASELTHLQSPEIRYFLSDEGLYFQHDPARQKQILDLIAKYVDFNSDLITSDLKSADFLLRFVDKNETALINSLIRDQKGELVTILPNALLYAIPVVK